MQSVGLLRQIGDNELEMMRQWRNAPKVRANMYTRHEISSAEHQAWWARSRQRDDQAYFMYECHGSAYGIVAFTAIDHVNQNCSWAFYAAPDAPQGTGTRMEFLALNHAFQKLRLNKLCCEVIAFNTPVLKLHEKFGFRTEGVLRQQHLVDGKFVDIHRLGLLRDEWSALRPAMQQRIESFMKA